MLLEQAYGFPCLPICSACHHGKNLKEPQVNVTLKRLGTTCCWPSGQTSGQPLTFRRYSLSPELFGGWEKPQWVLGEDVECDLADTHIVQATFLRQRAMTTSNNVTCRKFPMSLPSPLYVLSWVLKPLLLCCVSFSSLGSRRGRQDSSRWSDHLNRTYRFRTGRIWRHRTAANFRLRNRPQRNVWYQRGLKSRLWRTVCIQQHLGHQVLGLCELLCELEHVGRDACCLLYFRPTL